MSDRVQVSAWGFRHKLGPLTLPFRDHSGFLHRRRLNDRVAELTLSDIPKYVRDTFGVAGTEIPDWCVDDASDEEKQLFRNAVTREGVEFGLLCLDGRSAGEAAPDVHAMETREIRRLLSLGSLLGARAVRVNVYPPPIVEEGLKESYDGVVANLRDFAAFAQDNGIRLMIENHCALTNTTDAMNRLLDDSGSELGLVLDTGNLEPVQSVVIEAFRNRQPFRDLVDAEPAYGIVEAMLPRAEIVQLKTYGFHADGRSRVYDLSRMIEIIAASSFRGPITIECAATEEEFESATRRTVAMLRDSLPTTTPGYSEASPPS